MANILKNMFCPWLRKMCNATVTDILLHRYNRNWYITCNRPDTRGATYDDFSGQFFRIFEIIIFCFVVAIMT